MSAGCRLSIYYFFALLLALAVTSIFLLGLGGGFVFDDRQSILQNSSLRLAGNDFESLLYAAYSFSPGNGSRALSMLSFAIDGWRSDMDPAAFKVTNLLIHVVTTVVLAGFLRLLLVTAGWRRNHACIGSLAIAALWAVHPLQVSSVLYIVQRMQTLATLFVLLSLWAYLTARLKQIAGRKGRAYIIFSLLAAVLGLASKEDVVLLPLYALLLELTVLRFNAERSSLATSIRWGYAAAVSLAILFFVFIALPHYWHWGAYPGREFSSYERLLTQCRVLLMYIGQAFLPLSGKLPFFYDDFEVSRGLLKPPSTLLAGLILVGLLALALRMRHKFPVLGFGILFFFAGHALTSNVLNLELVFEHRNQLPLIGLLLAVAELVRWLALRFCLRRWVLILGFLLVVLPVARLTALRAYEWGDPERFALAAVRDAPNSARAWLTLCTHYFDLSDGRPELQFRVDQAILICERGARRTNSALLPFNVVVYKTIRGSATQEDWRLFLDRLEVAPINAETLGVYAALVKNVESDFPLDPHGTLKALALVLRHADLTTSQYVALSVYVFNNSDDPEAAWPYLEHAVNSAKPGDALVETMVVDLDRAGRPDLAGRIRQLQKNKL